jgi:hypothetical protein
MAGQWWHSGEMAAAKTKPDPESDVLRGLEQIGRYVGFGPAAIRRWVASEDFPARRLPDGSWLSSGSAITEWICRGRGND